MQIKRNTKGFTLLEILLVIAAIGILAAIVLIAINPNKQLAQARDTARQSDINTIQKALDQYLIERGAYPASVSITPGYICNTGTEQVGGGTNCSGRIDLRELVPTYIAAIPRDIQATGTSTGYIVSINTSNNKIVVISNLAERKNIAINTSIVTNGLVLNLDAGDIASYPGTGTTWTDLSGNGNNTALTNGPTYNSSNGGSIVIDGNDDYGIFSSQNFPSGNASFSLEAWVRFSGNGVNVNNVIMAYGADNGAAGCPILAVDLTGFEFVFGSGAGSVRSGTLTTTNVWYQVVGVYNGSTTKIYINGALVNTRAYSSVNVPAVGGSNGQTGALGALFSPYGNVSVGPTKRYGTFNGQIAIFRYFNRAVTDAEILQNFNALRGRYGL
jgi:prepilin-type N-terminal cleavage/methylation domain-containing protein